jgi:hypothetical protein
MAENAFWQLDRNQILDIADHLHLKVEQHMTLFDLLYTLVKQISKSSATVVLAILRKRIVQTEKSITHTDVLLEMDEAAACLVEEDRKQVILEQGRQQVKQVECKELRREYSENVVKKVHQQPAAAKSKPKPEFKLAYPKKLPVLETYPQKDLKKLLPPGGVIWRSRTDGAWCGRWEKMAPKSARDNAWGSEIAAVRCVLRHVWHDYLELAGYGRDVCPIKDLWHEGAGGVPSV